MSDPITILVIDDEELIRMNLRALIEDLGYAVMEAANGREGLEVMERALPEMVLTDLRMPEMDGLTLIETMRETYPDLPVIVISGTGTIHDAITAVRLGAWDYLLKPVEDVTEFEIVMKRTLNRARLQTENRRYAENLKELVRQQTKRIADSEARYKKLLESVTSYVYTVSVSEGRPQKTVHGHGCEAVTGFSSQEYAGDPDLWYRMVNEEDRGLVMGMAARVFDEADPLTIEHRIAHKDGSTRWVQNTLVPHRNADGELISYDGIISDITERRAAQVALQESETRYRTLVQTSPDPIVMFTPNGEFITANQSAAAMYGSSDVSHFLAEAQNIFTVLDDEWKKEAIVNIEKVWHGETPLNNEYELRAKDGRRVMAEVHTSLFRDREGKPSGLICIVHDITERKRAESHLRKETEQTKLFLDLYEKALQLTEREIYESVLEKAVALTDSTIGYFHRVSEDQQSIIFTAWNTAALKDCSVICEDRYPIADTGIWADCFRVKGPIVYNDYQNYPDKRGYPEGHIPIKRFMSIPVMEGGVVRMILGVGNKPEDYDEHDMVQMQFVANDVLKIIRQIRSEEALKESERRYRLLAENARDVIWVLDQRLRYTYVSPSVIHLRGYSVEEVMRQRLDQVLTPDSFRKAAEMFEREVTQERSGERDLRNRELTLELEMMRKDGSTIWTEVKISFLFNEEKEVTGIMGITRDITQRRKDAEDKRILESQLWQAQKMESIGTLAGGIAHDFNNILTSIIGFTELAQMKIEAGKKLKNELTEVLAAGARAKDLVKQILTFSRKTDIQREPMEITPLIKEAVKFIRASLPSTIEIRQDIKVAGAVVMANPTQIHQVLMNLCANAAHAMHAKGGILDIRLEELVLDKNETRFLKGLNAGRFVRLSVSDTGSGIPNEIIDRIFEPFFTTKARGEGTGMGLSMVHGIVEDMGGAITVKSSPGRGTTFHILLPLCQGETAKPETTKPLPEKRSGRILYVDDEAGIVASGRVILEELGYEVVATTSAMEALEIFKSRPEAFDLVLTDLTMPKITGIELSQRIMKIRRDIPILLCTGFCSSSDEAKIKKIGIKGMVMKPMTPRELDGAINALLHP